MVINYYMLRYQKRTFTSKIAVATDPGYCICQETDKENNPIGDVTGPCWVLYWGVWNSSSPVSTLFGSSYLVPVDSGGKFQHNTIRKVHESLMDISFELIWCYTVIKTGLVNLQHLFLEPKPTWLSKLKTTPLVWWYWPFVKITYQADAFMIVGILHRKVTLPKAKKLVSLLKTQVTIPQETLEGRESHSPPQTSAVHPCLLKAIFQDYCSFTSEIIDQPSEAPSSVPGAAGHWPSFG